MAVLIFPASSRASDPRQSLGTGCQKLICCARQLFSKVSTVPTSGLKTIHHFLAWTSRTAAERGEQDLKSFHNLNGFEDYTRFGGEGRRAAPGPPGCLSLSPFPSLSLSPSLPLSPSPSLPLSLSQSLPPSFQVLARSRQPLPSERGTNSTAKGGQTQMANSKGDDSMDGNINARVQQPTRYTPQKSQVQTHA